MMALIVGWATGKGAFLPGQQIWYRSFTTGKDADVSLRAYKEKLYVLPQFRDWGVEIGGGTMVILAVAALVDGFVSSHSK
jgi:hypothetical protein